MKRLGVFLVPQNGIPVHPRLPPRILSGFPKNNLLVLIYTPGQRVALCVFCLRTQLNVRPHVYYLFAITVSVTVRYFSSFDHLLFCVLVC